MYKPEIPPNSSMIFVLVNKALEIKKCWFIHNDTGYRIQDTGYRIQDKYFLSTDFTSTSEASSGVNKGVMGVIYPPPL